MFRTRFTSFSTLVVTIEYRPAPALTALEVVLEEVFADGRTRLLKKLVLRRRPSLTLPQPDSIERETEEELLFDQVIKSVEAKIRALLPERLGSLGKEEEVDALRELLKEDRRRGSRQLSDGAYLDVIVGAHDLRVTVVSKESAQYLLINFDDLPSPLIHVAGESWMLATYFD